MSDGPPDPAAPPYGPPATHPPYGPPATHPPYGPPATHPPYGPPATHPPYGPPAAAPDQVPTAVYPPYGATAPYPAYGPTAVQPAGRPRVLPWILAVVAVLVVLVLVVAAFVGWLVVRSPGWGRAVSSPAPTTAPTAPAAGDPASRSWLAATNAYCRDTTDPALKQIAPQFKTDPAAYFTRTAAINRELDAVLRRDPPAGLRPQVERIASHWDEMADLLDQAATAVRRGDQSGAGALLDRSDAANRLGNDLATRIGLPDCAQAGGIGETDSPSEPGLTV